MNLCELSERIDELMLKIQNARQQFISELNTGDRDCAQWWMLTIAGYKNEVERLTGAMDLVLAKIN